MDYEDMFRGEPEHLKKFVAITDILNFSYCRDFVWTCGDWTDGITLSSVRWKYSEVPSYVKYVEIIYNNSTDTFIVTNSVTGSNVSTKDAAEAAAVARSYVANFAALR